MTTANQMSTALLTEHFRYTPLTLLDDIINTVNELVFRAVNAIEEGLNNAAPADLGFKTPSNTTNQSEQAQKEALHTAKQTEIDNGIVQLETLLNATVDKDFDKFEIYTLRNILAVGHDEEGLAPWVQLEHYRNLELERGRVEPAPGQVQMQRRKLQETVKLGNMLKAEEARNEAVLGKLRELVGRDGQQNGAASPFGFLAAQQQTSKSSTSQPLNQNVQYAMTQLPALRELLSNLKDSLQTIPNARHASQDENSVAAKRRHYVESQSRRALERKGVDASGNGDFAAGSGRRIGRDEVEGIEAVVQALGGAPAVLRSGDDMEE